MQTDVVSVLACTSAGWSLAPEVRCAAAPRVTCDCSHSLLELLSFVLARRLGRLWGGQWDAQMLFSMTQPVYDSRVVCGFSEYYRFPFIFGIVL